MTIPFLFIDGIVLNRLIMLAIPTNPVHVFCNFMVVNVTFSGGKYPGGQTKTQKTLPK